MPEISASEYLNSLLAAYQTAEKHYSQAVTDLVAAEIRRDEAKTAKEEALIRLENARAKYGGTSSRKNPSPKKRNSLRGAQNKSPIFLKRGSFSFGKKGTGKTHGSNNQKLESVPLEPPIPGSKKPPKIFSKSQLKRLSTSKIAPGPFEPLESVRGVYDVCKGRSREWFDENLNCESLGLVRKFYQASFGMKTNEKTKEINLYTIVLNDDWNDLVSKTSEIQEIYIGKSTDPKAKLTTRDKAAKALVDPLHKEPIGLFFAPKNTKGTSDIYYVGHWKVVDGTILRPPRNVKGQPRQCLAKFKFVGFDQAIVEAINCHSK